MNIKQLKEIFLENGLEESDAIILATKYSTIFEIGKYMVEKRGDKWCVVHGHPQKAGSKTDKPKGSIIKCFDSEEKALAMHRAIEASKHQNK